jgi:hypothetical protein
MNTEPSSPETPVLFDLEGAAKRLGGISPWTLRKHIARGTVSPTRIGRRVFLSETEIGRIRTDGLPSLASTGAEGAAS